MYSQVLGASVHHCCLAFPCGFDCTEFLQSESNNGKVQTQRLITILLFDAKTRLAGGGYMDKKLIPHCDKDELV